MPEEELKICSVCEHKSDSWECELSKENIFTCQTCPLNKWDKGYFPVNETAKTELIQLGRGGVLDEIGALKIEKFSREAFSAQLKKKNLIVRPNKNLINKHTAVDDILYCIKNFPPNGWNGSFHQWDNTQEAYRRLISEKAAEIIKSEYPEERFKGRGIVMCGGGQKYFPSLYVNLRMIRLLGCSLPIEVYYLGVREMDSLMINILESIDGVKCIDATLLESKYPIRIHGGWESKVYSIINSSFEEVLMLDADNTCLVNPEFLFKVEPYQKTGAILWPDYECWRHDENLWKILGIKYIDELQVESGQVMVNKRKCWHEINMAKYFCDYSDYYFKLFYGDKEAFHFGWRFLDSDYGFPPGPDWINNSIIVQKDFSGAWLFSHRAQAKFKLNKTHKITIDMPYEQDTLDLLDELSTMWKGAVWVNSEPNELEVRIRDEMCNKNYYYIRIGMDKREINLLPANKIGKGADRLERHWYIFMDESGPKMAIHGDNGLTAILMYNLHTRTWQGRWLEYEKCAIEIMEIKQ